MVRRARKQNLSEKSISRQNYPSRYWYAPPSQSRTKEQAALSNPEPCRNRGARKASFLVFATRLSFQRIRSAPLPTQPLQLSTGKRYTALIPCKNVPFVRSSGSVKMRSLVLRL